VDVGSTARRRGALVGLCGLGLLALQTDLVAVASDSARYGSFDLGSGEFTPTPPDVHLAQVAHLDGGTCKGYVDDLDFGPYGDTFDLDAGTSPTFSNHFDVCVRNGGNVDGTISVSFAPATYASTESTGCAPGEATAGDTACAAASDPGELDDVLFLRLTSVATPTTSCTALPGTVVDIPFDTAAATPVVLATGMLPGYECAFDFRPVFRPGLTEAQKLVAQTDHIQWQLVFTLQDA
jgi:hypothetical protein